MTTSSIDFVFFQGNEKNVCGKDNSAFRHLVYRVERRGMNRNDIDLVQNVQGEKRFFYIRRFRRCVLYVFVINYISSL